MTLLPALTFCTAPSAGEEPRAGSSLGCPSVPPYLARRNCTLIENGQRPAPLDMEQVRTLITWAACIGLEKHVDAEAILAETVKNLYDGVCR